MATDQNVSEIHIVPLKKKLQSFAKKYFLEGQKLEVDLFAQNTKDATFTQKLLSKHRRLLALMIPFLFFQIFWWCLAVRHDFFQYFPAKYPVSVTMIFGAFIAGATSEGSGALVFPVMTLILNVHPSVARDFTIMIQSCGMTSASFAIFFMRLKLEYNSLVCCSLGGALGFVVGSHFVDPYISSPYKKMLFVSLTFSFGVVLFILNRKKKRITFDCVQNMNFWKAGVLAASGFAGGILTSFSGSGVDICSFSFLTLLFHVSEKVATPTSIILMAGNCLFGVFWRNYMIDPAGLLQEAWEYLAVCVPIATFSAPFGSLVASHFHRQVLASMIYILEVASLVSGFIFTRPDLVLTGISIFAVLVGSLFFFLVSCLGEKLTERTRLAHKNIIGATASSAAIAEQRGSNSGMGDCGDVLLEVEKLNSADLREAVPV